MRGKAQVARLNGTSGAEPPVFRAFCGTVEEVAEKFTCVGCRYFQLSLFSGSAAAPHRFSASAGAYSRHAETLLPALTARESTSPSAPDCGRQPGNERTSPPDPIRAT